MLSLTLTSSIWLFHRVSFILPVSSLIVALATLCTTSLYLDSTSRGLSFSVTWAWMSMRFIPSLRSFIFKMILPFSFFHMSSVRFFRDHGSRCSRLCLVLRIGGCASFGLPFRHLFRSSSSRMSRLVFLEPGLASADVRSRFFAMGSV